METLEAIKLRRSVREYKEKAIPKDILEKIVDAGRFAATARNIQPWEFVVATEKAALKKIGEIAETDRFIAQSGACIAVFCSDTKYYLEDGSAATENILLAATALGVASCWVAGDKKPYCSQISSLLNVSPSYKLVSLISLGYPESEKVFKVVEKRSLASVIHWEVF